MGKSNIFDAIEFLSRIASGPLMSAAEQIRAVGDNQGADPRSLFTVSETSSPTRVVSASSFDCFGRARHDSARRYLQLNVDALERVIAEGHYALEQSA